MKIYSWWALVLTLSFLPFAHMVQAQTASTSDGVFSTVSVGTESLAPGSLFTVGGTSGVWSSNPGSAAVVRAANDPAEGCNDILQLWPFNNPGNQGPGVRFSCYGDISTNRSMRISGSTINGQVPQVGDSSTMLAVQSDLGPGRPVVVIEGNISEDMMQPLISGYGNATERFRVDTHGNMWLRGPAAGLEVSRSGGSGPVTFKMQGQPTTNGNNVPIADTDIYSNTGDLVARLRVASAIANDGAGFIFYTKPSGGSLSEVARFTPYAIIFPNNNVGIGVTNPTTKLSVAGGALFDGGTVVTSNVVATSTVATAAGSVTAPSFHGPTANTGIYFPGADRMIFSVLGKRAFQVLNVSSNRNIFDLSSPDNPDVYHSTFDQNGTSGQFRTWNGSLSLSGDAGLSLLTNQQVRWSISQAGQFSAGTDNAYDIGASTAARPRTGYFGTSVVAPTVSTDSLLMKDAATGQTWCVQIVNGEWDKQPAPCS